MCTAVIHLTPIDPMKLPQLTKPLLRPLGSEVGSNEELLYNNGRTFLSMPKMVSHSGG